SFLRCRGYSAVPEPRRPFAVSTRVTRTLSVPKSTPATIAMGLLGSLLSDERLRRVGVHVPAKVSNGGFMHHGRNAGKIRRDVVLETVLADIVQQFL